MDPINVMKYYEWLFFKHSTNIVKWALEEDLIHRNVDIATFFHICLLLVRRDDLNKEEYEKFVINMWKQGRKRLAIGSLVTIFDNDDPQLIEFLGKDYFVTENGQHVPYEDIESILTIPQEPKYNKENIKPGMRVRLVNKNVTGNVYTITAVHTKGFDAKNGKYQFTNLEYSSIAKIIDK